MKRWLTFLLFGIGCNPGVEGTVVYGGDSLRQCPDDRPLIDLDLDCVCGVSGTIIDTTLPDDCDELWCNPAGPDLTCITYGTGTGDTGA